MQKLGVLQIGFHACRHFTASSINCNHSSRHEARVWEKLLKRGSKNPIDLKLPVSKGPSSHVSRRATVLNKTYMNYVIQIMSNCNVYEEIVGTNIQLSQVQITNDFKLLNIYWHTDLKDSDFKMLEERLHRYAGPLRHRLAQLRVIGRVPQVQFVRDKRVNLMYEIEQRLAQADFGEDYERTPACLNTEHSVTYSTENADRHKKLKSYDIEETFSVTLPEMRHDVFGLDCTKIMQKIQVAVNKKVSALEKRKNAAPNHIASDSEQENNFTFLTHKEQEKKFNEFLRKRRIEQRKRKALRSHMDIEDFRTDFEEP